MNKKKLKQTMKDILVDVELDIYKVAERQVKKQIHDEAVRVMAKYLRYCLDSAVSEDYECPPSELINTQSEQQRIKDNGVIFRTMLIEIYDDIGQGR
jgi:hypothetical protein